MPQTNGNPLDALNLNIDAYKGVADSRAKEAQDRGLLDSSDVDQLLRGKFGEGKARSPVSAMEDSSFAGSILKEIVDSAKALNFGAHEAVGEIVAGPVQFSLERVSPEAAQSFTDWVKRGNDAMRPENAAEHPIAEGVGGALGGAAALGGPAAKAVGAVEKGISILKAGGIGALFGLSSFQEEPQSIEERGAEAIEGGAAGLAFGAVGKGVSKGLEKASRSKAIEDFTLSLKQQVGTLLPHLSSLKDKIDARFSRLSKEVRDAYSSRDQHGSATVPSKVVRDSYDALAEKLEASTVDPVIGSTLQHVGEKLKVPEIKAAVQENQRRLLAHQQQIADYQKGIEASYQAYREAAQAEGKSVIDLADFAKAAQTKGMKFFGVEPPRMPDAPQLVGVPKPDLNDIFASYTRVNADLKRGANPAKTTQLNQVKSFLTGLVDQSNHPNAKEALKAMDAASQDYIEKIVPYRKQFGFKAFESGATGGRTPVDVYNIAVRLIEGKNGAHDIDAIKGFSKLVGSTGDSDLQQIALSRALHQGAEGAGGPNERVNPDKVAAYLGKHRSALKALLPPDKMNEIDGFIKLTAAAKADAINAKKNRSILSPSHLATSGAGTWAIITGAEHIAHGDVGSGVRNIASGFAIMFGTRMFGKLASNVSTARIMQKAARYKPGSKELTSLLKQIDRATSTGAAVGGKDTAQELGGGLLGN